MKYTLCYFSIYSQLLHIASLACICMYRSGLSGKQLLESGCKTHALYTSLIWDEQRVGKNNYQDLIRQQNFSCAAMKHSGQNLSVPELVFSKNNCSVELPASQHCLIISVHLQIKFVTSPYPFNLSHFSPSGLMSFLLAILCYSCDLCLLSVTEIVRIKLYKNTSNTLQMHC
jgi:hypothetical protein